MKDKELEITKPIKPVGDISVSREEKYEDVLEDELETREEKYQRKILEEKDKILEEEAEIALARRNIEMAEAIEAEEALVDVDDDEPKKIEVNDEPKKKEKAFVRLKNWWKSLDNGQKWIYGVLIFLFFLLFILLIVGAIVLLHKDTPKEETKEPEQTIVEEQPPIMFDNYYYKNGKLVFLGEGGTEIGTYTCDNKDETLCSVAVNNYRDVLDVPRVIDENGKDKVEYVGIVNDDFVFINDTDSETSKNIVLYSMKKNEKIAVYHDVKAYDGGYYAVSNEKDEYGLIQIGTEVKETIRFQYPYLGMIDNENYLVAKEGKGFIIIDKKDKGISKYITTQEVKYYNSNFIVTKDEGTYSVYNFKGEQLVTGYTFATVKGKYMFLVDSGKVYVKDVEGNKFNENGVELKNLEYVKSFVFDENDEMVKTKRSFEIEVKGDNIAVAVYDSDYDNPQFSNINILEGNLNKKYEYINYFDGILYLYRDVEKNDLIGNYVCTSKNEIDSKTEEYTTCFIAKDTVFEDNDSTTKEMKERKTRVPLMNNKYILVSDGDKNIVLYDVEAGLKKSAYQNVDTSLDDNNYTFVSENGKFDIIGLNKKGKYGVIKIEGFNVSSLYSFNYNKIERLGAHFIAQDANDKWLILSKDQTTGIFSNKIMGFTSDLKHVKTFDGKKYKVYEEDGTPVSEETYSYVELFDNYYVTVDEGRKISVYDYSGKKLSALGTAIPEGVALSRTANKPFKIKRTNEGFTISVYDGSKYVEHNTTIIPDETEQSENQTTSEEKQQQ